METTKVCATISMREDGMVELRLEVLDSKFEKNRFYDGEYGAGLRYFNYDKKRFQQACRVGESFVNYYEAEFSTVDDATNKLNEILEEFQRQDRALAEKEVNKKYEVMISPEKIELIEK